MSEENDDSQKTEEPTQKRLEDSREKGDVVKSSELSSFIMLGGGTLALALFSQSATRTFATDFLRYLERPDDIVLDSGGAMAVMSKAVWGLFAMLAPSVSLLMLAAVGGHVIQNRPTLSIDRVAPDMSKLSILKGAKRLFGLDGIINIVKGVAKILMVGTAAVLSVWPERSRLASALDMNPAGMMGLAMALIFKMLLASLVVLAMIAAADYLYQYQRFMSRNRMSRQELKDEMKQSDGDPQVKARIRQLRFERSRKRMIAAVPQATVVITNPTHYAVALKYESGKMGAPVCVAKGMDALALRIREVAKEHDVPVVENPPLARALYASVEIDQEVPAEHYKAVAQVIGFVMRLANKNKFWRN